jgi:ATP dependent DNA ligase C terminal region
MIMRGLRCPYCDLHWNVTEPGYGYCPAATQERRSALVLSRRVARGISLRSRPGIGRRRLHRPARDPHRVRGATAQATTTPIALVYAGKAGTGVSRHTLDRLHAMLAGVEQDRPCFDRGHLPRSGVHWVEPRLVAQVGFSEWTTDGQLRHPRFQGLRDDKDPPMSSGDAPRHRPVSSRASRLSARASSAWSAMARPVAT